MSPCKLTAKFFQQIQLPEPLDYVSRDPVPFRILLTTDASAFVIPFPKAQCSKDRPRNPQCIDADQLTEHLSIELVKVFSIRVAANRTIRREIILSKGTVCQVKTDLRLEPGSSTQLAKAYGVVRGGKDEGEMNWSIQRGPTVHVSTACLADDGLLDAQNERIAFLQYEIRAILTIPSLSNPNVASAAITYRHSEIVGLKTHFREELMDELDAQEPALGLLA